MDKNLGLGKGLSALMGESFSQPVSINKPVKNNEITYISISCLVPSPFQPRRVFSEDALADLVQSIKEKGVLQPLLVRKHPNNDGIYEIIAGERRYRASKQVGLEQLPVIIKDFNDRDTLEVALIENLQREDLNPFEEGEAYQRLLEEYNYTQEELSKVIGKSRSYISNTIRMLSLPDGVKEYVENGELSMGHARALLNSDNPKLLADEIAEKGLSVRQAEKLALNYGVKTRKNKVIPVENYVDKDIMTLENEVSGILKSPVSIKWNGKKGSVVIKYESWEKLNIILQRLTAHGVIKM